MSNTQNGSFSFDLSAAFANNPFGDPRDNPLGIGADGDLRDQIGGIGLGPSPLEQLAANLMRPVLGSANEAVLEGFDTRNLFDAKWLRERFDARQPFRLTAPNTGNVYVLTIVDLDVPNRIADCSITALDHNGVPYGNSCKVHLERSETEIGLILVRPGWHARMEALDSRS